MLSLPTNPTAERAWAVKFWRLTGRCSAAFLAFLIILWFTTPSFEWLENPDFMQASQVLGDDGTVIGKYFYENRTPAKASELPEHLIQALEATEDVRFHEHAGIDRKALGRVALKTILGGDQSSGGGSTITQQLAKMILGRPSFKGWRKIYMPIMLPVAKFREWMTAVKLERCYTKEEIAAMYLNKFDYLYGAYGVKSAAKIYFGKNLKDLNIQESAMLVGMFQNPHYFNPVRFPERAKKRRDIVFLQMYNNGVFGEGDEAKNKLKSLKKLPLDTKRFKREDHNTGLAAHFREHVREQLVDILKDNPKPGGGEWNVYTDGLRIYTTIDANMQAHAEKAAREHLASMQAIFDKHWSTLDPWNRPNAEVPLLARQEQLQRFCHASRRWEAVKERLMPTATKLDIDDLALERMILADQKKLVLEKLVSQKSITAEKLLTYKATMASADFPTLKKEHKRMWEYFKKPIKDMEVFAYTDKKEYGTQKVDMSPYDSVRYHRMMLQVGLCSVEPETGHVKAWVGGTDHRFFQYDHVNKDVRRQVGSTIKPFLYATALEHLAMTPNSEVEDVPTSICPGNGSFGLGQCWTPQNANRKTTGVPVPLTYALKQSLNTVSAGLMKMMGSTQPLRETLEKAGIEPSLVPAQPSIALGAIDLSPLHMAGAYTIFPNAGFYSEPVYILKVEDRFGNLIYEASPTSRPVISETGAYLMCKMMENVVSDASGFKFRSAVGGKTGTTNYQADGWFVGVNPNLVTAIWTGCDDRFVHFRDMSGQGARMARPIYVRYFTAVERDRNVRFPSIGEFKVPEGYTPPVTEPSPIDTLPEAGN